ncbi:hypothetical protein [Argonema galeatum]|uniref:hypothetical protein n=1 Tax=Argonema galeatum TaxID=2942762 RepID=UPI002012E605|nr:hypothetical protein [Argonema galeatum]MCL1465369.1 hypothetical protein [Argonema galeatum A003/A1]
MNWKMLSLAAGLVLATSLTACSNKSATENQVSPTAVPASNSKPADAMKKDDATKPADAMKKDDATKPADAMKKDDATKKSQ